MQKWVLGLRKLETQEAEKRNISEIVTPPPQKKKKMNK
jgi:hypothetical protein